MISHTLEEWDEIEEECGSELMAELEAKYEPIPSAEEESNIGTETEMDE